MLELLPELILFILVLGGTFYIKYRFLFKKRRKAKKNIKPYYLMNKKELKKLECEVEENILERDKIIRALSFLKETKSLNVDMITYIKDIVVQDTEMKFSKTDSFLDIINKGMKSGYISSNSLQLIKTKIEDAFLA